MRNFHILPLDTTLRNTESALNFNNFQKLDMQQTDRLMTRIQLANYFKQQAFETIGITPQRLGGEVEQATATGVRVAVSNSYAQTETYFIQHCDYLMPRVHQMRTDLAQYYQSKNPSTRLSYITTAEDRINFQINGTSLLLRDLNIFSTTKANTRAIIDQLKQLALNSTSSSATIYDLGNIIKSESIAEVDSILKQSQQRAEKEKQDEMQNEQALKDKEIQDRASERKERMAFDAAENEKDRQAGIIEAEINAAGRGSGADVNQNEQSDYVDALDTLQKGESFKRTMDLQNTKQQNQVQFHNDKMDLGREKLAVQKQANDNQVTIARENLAKTALRDKQKAKEAKKKKK
jgi:hypothetical protein